jgi:hypothetical protein
MTNYIINLETEKFCKKGSHVMPKTEFSSENNKKDGLRSTCKECTKLKNKLSYEKHKVVYKKKRTEKNISQKIKKWMMYCLNKLPYDDVIDFIENKNILVLKHINTKLSYDEIIHQIEN